MSLSTGQMFRRAWRDTIGFFGWNVRSFLVPIVLLFVGTGIHTWRFGLRAAMDELDIVISYALAPVGAFTIVLFLWNLYLTPSRIMMDRLDNLETALGGTFTHTPLLPKGLSDKWRHVTILKLWEAAFLMENEEPQFPIGPGMGAFGALQALISAINDKKLAKHRGVARGVGAEWIQVRRDDVINWCEKENGKVPPIWEKEQ